MLTAGYKVGKTTLMGNLVKSLADDEPFLGEFDTHFDTGTIAYLNYELDADTFREWMRDIGVVNTDRVTAPLHLRGFSLPFWVLSMHDRTCEWLRENAVAFIIFDPTARAWHGLVDNENDNSQVGAFCVAVDELKRQAGIQDCLLAAHTGRAEHLEGAERARGATRLEDWADALWYLEKDKHGTRSLRAMGRDVELEATVLDYDIGTRILCSTGRTRAEDKRTRRVMHALGVLWRLKKHPKGVYPTNSGDWQKAMEGENSERQQAIREAVRAGYVSVEVGAKNAKLHTFTPAGLRAFREHVEASK